MEGFAELRPCQDEYRGPVGHQSQQADDWHDNGLNHKTVDRNNGKRLSTRGDFKTRSSFFQNQKQLQSFTNQLIFYCFSRVPLITFLSKGILCVLLKFFFGHTAQVVAIEITNQ